MKENLTINKHWYLKKKLKELLNCREILTAQICV